MTGQRNHDTGTVSRRRVLKASGAAALAAGLAGCEGGVVTPDDDDDGGDQQDDGDSDVGGGDTVPVLSVTSRGIPQEKASALAEELGVDAEFRVGQHGVLQYVDEDAYMPVPTADVGADQAAFQDEDETQDRRPMAMDVEALEELPEPPNADELEAEFMGALEATEPLPAAPLDISTSTSHAEIGIESAEDGTTRLQRPLDTAVYVTAAYDGIPLEGPGAKIRGRASIAGPGQTWSDVRHSFRQVEAGEEVKLRSRDEVVTRYQKAVDQKLDVDGIVPTEPRLVYLAPELRRENPNPVGDGPNEVQALVPHYSVGGTVRVGEQEAELLREFVPATTDGAYVPEIELSATAQGDVVEAKVGIEGGQQPYRVEWSVSDGTLAEAEGAGAELSSSIDAREAIEETTLTARVTDANGVTVSRREDLTVQVQPSIRAHASGGALGAAVPATGSTVPGPIDVGHRATDFTGWARGYETMAKALGVSVSTTYRGNAVWENDYTDPTDNEYGVDNADHFFTCAHGNPMGYAIPNNCCDDGFVHHTNADGAWGDYDLEWHSLMSCNVLAPDDGKCGGCNGKSRVERWSQEFDGLHQLHGFQTLGWVVDGFPEALARYVFGASFLPALKMRTAWLQAVDNYQPGYDPDQAWKRRGVVMWTADEHWRSGKDDYFHGRGPVGPDIARGDVRWICWIVASTGGG